MFADYIMGVREVFENKGKVMNKKATLESAIKLHLEELQGIIQNLKEINRVGQEFLDTMEIKGHLTNIEHEIVELNEMIEK